MNNWNSKYYEQVRDLIEERAGVTTSDAQGIIEARATRDDSMDSWEGQLEPSDAAGRILAPWADPAAPNYTIRPMTGKADKRNRVTHLFKHTGPGQVEHVGSYASGSDAMRTIGMGNACMVGYNRNEVSVIRTLAHKYHPITMDNGPKAKEEAERRALIHEIHQRMNVPALCAMKSETLRAIAEDMGIA